MKKLILSSLIVLFASSIAVGQVAFSIDPPSPSAGGYDMTWADDPGTWGSPDLNDPANVIQGTLCLGQDSLACEALTNGADLVGKIAVVYRGECEFGFKALQCQNEGAIACVIINNAGDPVGMAGGAEGLNVTIPVIMISTSAGASLYDEIAACNVNATIGNLNGFYADNLRITRGGIIRPESYGLVAALNQNESEFSINPSAWVYNFGTEDESAAVLNFTVGFEGSELYNESSDGVAIAAGDSAFVTLPVFEEGSYATGTYSALYTVSGTSEDQFTGDNERIAHFEMGDVLSYARLTEDNQADPITFFRTGGDGLVEEGNFCIFFEDPNASRVALSSFDFTGTVFEDEETIVDIDVEVVAYTWEDEFNGLDTELTLFGEEESEAYTFQDGDDEQIINLAFSSPLPLLDNQPYLFCLRHEDPLLAFGYDNQTSYIETATVANRPVNPQWDGAGGFTAGFGLDAIPSISVNMVNANGLDEASENVEITPFPNPAAELLTIPLSAELRGQALMSIFNTEGKVVRQETINLTGSQLEVNISGLSNGNYLFDLQFEGQKESTFSVVVNR